MSNYNYTIADKLSGIEINQDKSNGSTANIYSVYQEFKLPDNYARSNSLIPDISGFQFLANYTDNSSLSLEYYFQYYNNNTKSWTTLRTGSITSTNGPKLVAGAELNRFKKWYTVRFDPIEITKEAASNLYRFKITGNSQWLSAFWYQKPSPQTYYTGYYDDSGVQRLLNYDKLITNKQLSSSTVTLTLNNVTNLSVKDKIRVFGVGDPFDGNFEITNITNNNIQYKVSSTQTVSSTAVNPTGTLVKDPSSLTFRLLTLTGDSGTDLLGNQYRSYVHKASVKNVAESNDNYWLSKPNPSKFAVENVYFDISQSNAAVTIDSVLIEPITPNVYFNVYYSNDDSPGYNDDSWDNHLWTRVPKIFKATKKDVYVFPEAISAKYIKIEFSHLQAKYYSPGAFQKPILYKKHPQWVFDYFIAYYEYKNNKTYDPFIQNQITIDYDVLDLGYNYYKGDIIQSPSGTMEIEDIKKDQTLLLNLLTDHRIHSNQTNKNSLDLQTLNQIKTIFNRFTSHPTASSNTDSVVTKLASGNASSTISAGLINGRAAPMQNYPLENINLAVADTSQVSTINRDPLILEKNFPVMFFYVNCRHGYKEAYARFNEDKAYFAGVKNVVFQRNNHAIESDEGTYMYGTGSFDLNVKTNDFVLDNKEWKAV